MRKIDKQTKRPKAYQIIARRIIALGLALWFFAMALLTWAMAEDMHRQIKHSTFEYANSIYHRNIIHADNTDGLPGDVESEMLSLLTMPYFLIEPEQFLPIALPPSPSSMSSNDWLWGKWNLVYGFETAGIFYGNDGEPLIQSGNYIKFVYTDETNWNNNSADILGVSYINVDALDDNTDALDSFFPEHHPYSPFLLWYGLPLLRLTGYFEGNEFLPTRIDRVDEIYSFPDTYDVEEFITQNTEKQMRWRNLLTANAPADRELTTVYAWKLDAVTADFEPIKVKGSDFDSLVDLLHTSQTTGTDYNTKNMFESVIINRSAFHDNAGNAYNYGIAVRCWPLQYAVLRLLPVYLVTLGLVLIALHLMLNKIREQITTPLEYMITCIDKDWSLTPYSLLEELYRLEQYYSDTYQANAEAKHEITQLKTALNFAHHAEENRRQLISNITHELKTPLAVIHSYAEGLQTGIAVDKQERYLSVILDETERMDDMVLQMLDLSRLEAGKVRLAADQFSLPALTRSVTEKFAPMLEAKKLTLSYGLTEDFTLIADESRIRQVITNLLSNALKYTPSGGRIVMNIYVQNHSARFSVINTADHLPSEALTKIWDSFYRVDNSRTEKGTGLGLTLVKSIIELHQGSCYVRNTMDKTVDPPQNAVEFGFSIPLR